MPFDHLAHLTGALHKWLGPNEVHDSLSLYSFGWLSGGKQHGSMLHFSAGANWWIAFADPSLIQRVRDGILADPLVDFGMRVMEAQSQPVPAFGPAARFLVDGPVLTRRNRDDGGRDHLTFRDPEADATLTRTLRRKLEALGLSGDHLLTTVRFDRSFQKARTKLVTVKGVSYRANECPIVVDGTPEAVQAAWLVGVGEMTGMGLGSLK